MRMVEYKAESNELKFWERVLPYAIEIYSADFDPDIDEDPMTWYAYIYTRDGYCIHDTNKPYELKPCLLYTSPSPRDRTRSRMPSSA